jgi:hypothetical protein
VAIDIKGESVAAIAGKPAPTGISVVFVYRIQHKILWERLARDEADPATLASTDNAPSRAGSLPRGKERSAYNNEIG